MATSRAEQIAAFYAQHNDRMDLAGPPSDIRAQEPALVAR